MAALGSRRLIWCLAIGFLSPSVEAQTYHQFEIEGWTIQLSRNFETTDREALERFLPLLEGQLERVVEAVPATSLQHLREVIIYVNPLYPGQRPKAEYHPGAQWLVENKRDPAMVQGVEITNVSIFPFENRRMPFLLLHELAHAYHDQVLGFDHLGVKDAFAQADRSGRYESVKRFNGTTMTKDRAYALENHREYFAESTEAFFGKNDFFPFTSDELKEHDPIMFQLLDQLWR